MNRAQRRQQAKALKKGRAKGQAGSAPLVTRANMSQALQAAVQLHQKGDLKQAETLYGRVLEVEPNHPDALNGLGMIDYASGHYDEALARIRKALEINPENAGYDMNLGAVLEKAGDLDAAKEAYEGAIRLAPRYGDPYYNLGDIFLREGRAEEAVAVFDRCMDACGREFHALAYKAHALFDAGQHAEAERLLDFDTFVKAYRFDVPDGFDDLAAFNKALARHIKTHPTLAGNVMSTENGKHTGELIREPLGPMAGMVERINEGIEWYKSQLPEDPDHPAVKYAPKDWRLTAWGVVMHNRGHERAHIHPNGWLSGVFYVQLPDVIEDEKRAPEGWLEFGKPTADLHVQHQMAHRHFKPELGQMFLFPSYFYHGTVPFQSDQRRICVAFDVEPAHEPRRH